MESARERRDGSAEAGALLWISNSDHGSLVRCEGEIDLSNIGRLAKSIRSASARGAIVQVDLANVSFIDSCGLRTLLLAQRWLRAEGGDLVVVDVSKQVRHVMDVIGVWPVLSGIGSFGR